MQSSSKTKSGTTASISMITPGMLPIHFNHFIKLGNSVKNIDQS